MKKIFSLNNLLPIIITLLTALVSAFVKHDIGVLFPIQSYTISFSNILNNLNAIFTFISIIVLFLLIPILVKFTIIILDGKISLIDFLRNASYGLFPLLLTETTLYLFIDYLFSDYVFLYDNNESIINISNMLNEDIHLQVFKWANNLSQIFWLLWLMYSVKKLTNLTKIKAIVSVVIPVLLMFIFTAL